MNAVRAKILAVLEILLVYAAMQALVVGLRGVMRAEIQSLGWSYLGSLFFAGVPAAVIWLTRRRWADYGVTLKNWPVNLEIGMRAYLVAFIPIVLGLGGSVLLRSDYKSLRGGLLIAFTEIIAIAVMLWTLRRMPQPEKATTQARTNLIVIGLLLLFPIALAWAMNKLTLIIVSTIVWQFVCSGFGEEFVWRGYVQSRLNQAFGRPWMFFGVPCGPGLIIASLLFGLLHAFNTFDPAAGQYQLAWGWALWTCFSGLFFGLIREKTGSLLACGIAHGLPDAVGEAAARVLGWM